MDDVLLPHEIERLTLERDLYWRLLELGTREDLKPLLEEALSLIVEVTNARKGYLALYHEKDGSGPPSFFCAKDCSEDEVQGIHEAISKGIIAEAMATGQTILTRSALADPRFQENQSVLANQIGAVLCAPVGLSKSLGVLYLQERQDGASFTKDDRGCVEVFARCIAPFVERIELRKHAEADLTLSLRKRLKLDEIVGCSRALADVLAQVENAARFQVGVLLTGASGTGKTALARTIHENGPRAKKPFVELNCATLQDTLVESELFGHKRGGLHGGAVSDHEGLISAANGGTLFLDEVGELSQSAQSKLLKFLQSGKYHPLGSTQEKTADVRLISATNVNLEEAISEKKFREDLYYRLKVMPLRLPSLSERKEDIVLLARYFCEKTCQRHGLPLLALTPAAQKAAELAEWPGNIRQLAHAVEVATIRAVGEGASAIEQRHLFPEARSEMSQEQEALTLQESIRQFQKKILQETLKNTSWNVSETARKLDISRSYLNSLIQTFGLRRQEPRRK